MVSTKTFTFYLMFVLIFNFFAGSFSLSVDDSSVDVQKSLLSIELRDKINKWIGFSPLKIVTNIVALPFIILESLLFVLSIIGIGFSNLPFIVEILLFTPLGIMVTLEYIIPSIRGN